MATYRTLPHLSLADILTRSSILGEFVKKSEQLTQLNRTVVKKLDSTLSPHCRVISFSHNILTITTSSPMWGHKLRFKVPELLENLRQDPKFAALKTITTKVCPEEPDSLSVLPALPKPHLTQESAVNIALCATEISSPKLQQALLRLAKRQVASAGDR